MPIFLSIMTLRFAQSYLNLKIMASSAAVSHKSKLRSFLCKNDEIDINLQFLDLTDNDVQIISPLISKRVVLFRLDSNYITNHGIFHIKDYKWNSLHLLSINSNNISTKGVKLMSNMKIPHLNVLSLADNKLENQSLIHLSKMNCMHLSSINLSKNVIGDRGLIMFMNIECKDLSCFVLNETRLSHQGKQRFLQLEFLQLRTIKINNMNDEWNKQSSNYIELVQNQSKFKQRFTKLIILQV